MRHLWSFLAGIVAAPVAWLLLATGQHRSQATIDEWGAANAFNTADLVGPTVFLVLAGILLGVLGTMRWSPLGPLTAGLLLVLPSVFLFINPFRTLDAVSGEDGWRLLGQDFAPRAPVENGTLLVLGALLVMATFSGQRWRRWPQVPEPIPPATDSQVISGMEELASTAPGTAMTDEQILAEARAYEQTEQTEHAEAEPAAAADDAAEAGETPEAGDDSAASETSPGAPTADSPDDSAESPQASQADGGTGKTGS